MRLCPNIVEKTNLILFEGIDYAILKEKVRKIMFKRIKEIFKKEEETVIITIHGFGVRREHEMDDFKEYAQLHLPPVITFNLFDIDNVEDCDYKNWVIKAETVVLQALHNNQKIILLGFSMGGVIASYLASKYPIHKLILISPAFIHFHLENYTSIAIQSGKKLLAKKEEEPQLSIPKSFYSGFVECVKQYKNAIQKVFCPVLILQGDEDEIIPTKSSSWAYSQIPHSQKKCLFLHLGKHRLLVDEEVKDVAFTLIDDFIHDKILPKEK